MTAYLDSNSASQFYRYSFRQSSLPFCHSFVTRLSHPSSSSSPSSRIERVTNSSDRWNYRWKRQKRGGEACRCFPTRCDFRSHIASPLALLEAEGKIQHGTKRKLLPFDFLSKQISRPEISRANVKRLLSSIHLRFRSFLSKRKGVLLESHLIIVNGERKCRRSWYRASHGGKSRFDCVKKGMERNFLKFF